MPFGTALMQSLYANGHFQLNDALTASQCEEIRCLYERARFRQTVRMTRDDYGLGEYKYFDYPLPRIVQALREDWYARLVDAARSLGGQTYPDTLREYIADCRALGQREATPLLLTYSVGGMNALHQDRYGAEAFPLQVMIMLSEPGVDFTGGAFVLEEQVDGNAPTMRALNPPQGSAVVFPNQHRPGSKPGSTVAVRHGVDEVLTGHRTTLGLIFHDARRRRRRTR